MSAEKKSTKGTYAAAAAAAAAGVLGYISFGQTTSLAAPDEADLE